MASFYEKNWKPVKLKQVEYPTGKGFATGNSSIDWYNRLLIRNTDRKTKIERFENMDTTIDISRALDVIAEDISSEGAETEKTFNLVFPDDFIPTKTQLKTLEATLKLWEETTEFDHRFFDFIREAVKFGFILFLVAKDGTLKKLIQERIEGYQLDAEDDTVVTHYLYNHAGPYKNENGDIVYPAYQTNQQNLQMIPIEDIFILKIGDGPFGESLLDRVYRVWRQLQLLEDAVVIYRIVRAPERRVFYIDIGNMPSHKSESYLEQVKNKLRQKQMMRDGQVETEYNPASMQEDFIIGQSGDGRGSKVETLPGGDNLGEIEDLQYFNKKLALGLRIPPSYMDTYSESGDGSAYNDGKVGTAYIAELRYVGYVKRLQKNLSKALFINFTNFCKRKGVEVPEELGLSISPPQSFTEYKDNELYSSLLTTYASADSLEVLSKRYSLEKFLRMSKEDLLNNEIYKLEEKGLSEEQVKKLTNEQRMNIVYGDGTLNPFSAMPNGDETDTIGMDSESGTEILDDGSMDTGQTDESTDDGTSGEDDETIDLTKDNTSKSKSKDKDKNKKDSKKGK